MTTKTISNAGFENQLHPDFLHEIGTPYRNLTRVRLVKEQDNELEDIRIKSPAQIFDNFYLLFGDQLQTRERFFCVFLDTKNSPITYYELGTGGIAWCSYDIKLLFCAGLLSLASSVVIMHNHPSGNLTPSEQDINITKKIKKAGELIEIKLIDHVIFTKNDYYSFLENGVM